MRRLIIVAAMSVLATSVVAKQYLDANGNGVVVSHKTGARANVGTNYAPRFQAYINDLEQNHGATVRFMGGIRRGRCWTGGMHPCGKALDVCQLRRGVVDHRCHLPSRQELARIAASHGLVEGGRWHHSDYGHAQVGGYTGMALNEMGRVRTASYSAKRRHHHRLYRMAAYRPAKAVHVGWGWSAL